mgnify:CR=1 FL=1
MKEQGVIKIDPLLYKIHQKGWTDRLARRFEGAYARKLSWQIVVQMEKMGFLQRRFNPQFLTSLSTRRLELYENTLSDLWIELLNGLVGRFISGVEEGRVHNPFVYYVGGVIRHLLVANARSLGLINRETVVETIRGICQAKQEDTLNARIAWAKFCYERRVREEILNRCTEELFFEVYRNIHHIEDYFFEKFLVAQCEQRSQYSTGDLTALIDRFLENGSDLSEALDFIGTITPFPSGGEVVGQVPEMASDDEYLSALHQASQRGWR